MAFICESRRNPAMAKLSAPICAVSPTLRPYFCR